MGKQVTSFEAVYGAMGTVRVLGSHIFVKRQFGSFCRFQQQRLVGVWLLVGLSAWCWGCRPSGPEGVMRKGKAIVHGAFLGEDDLDKGFKRFSSDSGRKPHMLLTFVPWAENGGIEFPEEFCSFARDRGCIPIVTLEPWEPWRDWYPLMSDVAEGRYDEELRDWAVAANEWGGKLLLRFAHEMNGHWYPWSVKKDSRQTAASYVAAWRRVCKVFRSAGAKNVEFVWCANFEPAKEIGRYYPGGDYVDVIGIDVYNRPPWARSPEEMLAPMLEFARECEKPVLLTEVGCAEKLGKDGRVHEKSAWIAELFELLEEERLIRGIVWFDVEKEFDWRIGSSPQSMRAYRRGMINLDTGGAAGQ